MCLRKQAQALGLVLPAIALLAGCGAGQLASPVAVTSAAKPITGKAYGGQQPVTGSAIALYTFGTSGYGSTGTVLASTTTDSTGYFTIDPASINCPSPSTPVYILSMGGNPGPVGGNRNNAAIMLGSALGPCAAAANTFVTVNEISTAMMAYTLSHFFSAGSSDGTTTDHFGGPASQMQTVAAVNNGTVATLLDVKNGYPVPNTATLTFEGSKLISLGNILGACVNSVGSTSPACSALFSYVTPANGAAPTNTLEAAIDLAQNPAQNVPYVFALQPQSGAAAFTGGLTTPPADWTLSASYTTANAGLGLNTRSVSTIDIDSTGRVWFPSNAAGKTGVGYFDPANGSFSTVYPGSLSHPQEIAIDADDYVWANDFASSNVAGFPANAPSAPVVLSYPGSVSASVTTAVDNSMRFGIITPSGLPALAQVTGKNSYTETPNTEVPNGGGFVASSVAADVLGGIAAGGQQLSTPTTYDFYFTPSGSITPVTYQSFQDSGQIAFTSSDYAQARGGYGAGGDGLCIFTQMTCYPMNNDAVRHPSGTAIDGNGTLWMADNFTNSVEQIPLQNGSYLTGGKANNTVFVHDSNNGGTLPGPAGIAVDRAGNVWVSNYGCSGNGCTPGNFVLTELLGAAAPTITPVSRQIVTGNFAGSQPQARAGNRLPQ